ncbi:DUF6421 family protein [Bailinhaonella thermotolerans]|uniref:DUF4350 domain-containing protein n=1 Tax=Bailinhaonella thermotolerans TaxID=1070861 RepID=A0A3A4A0J3_9ACTN|nr:DUF6421 family protein [Bailinhaonella thermotolerans]RJL20528.1 hypothetical protein D5H75_39350 [Bailinhaonella thermotolerans]
MRAFPRVLFDEAHGQAWSIRREVAAGMNPGYPEDSAYTRAAERLRRLGHDVAAHAEGALTPEVLAGCDVLVIAHPSDSRWERTIGGDPVLGDAELDAVEAFVREGGGLVVLGEYEQDKYGNNLNDLLGRFGLGIAHAMAQDPARCERGVAAWVRGEPAPADGAEDLLAGARSAVFYRTGVVRVGPEAEVLFRTSPTAHPAGEPLAAAVRAGEGRVVVFADSDLFGDDSIGDHDHETLWGNVVTWAARRPAPASAPAGAAAGSAGSAAAHPVTAHPAWERLKAAVEELRPLQAKDGSVERGDPAPAVAAMSEAIGELAPLFPHDAGYLAAVLDDLRRWAGSGYGVPDFLPSLLAFRPELQRVDGREHLVVFPMYTQNGNPNRNFEAVLIRTVWPSWLADLERERYDNPMFVPIAFVDFTAGYDTDSAVLFPETVSVHDKPERFTWGGIFCDREAARFRAVSAAAARTLKLALPPDAARLLESQELAQDTFVLWDLVHDRTHSHGDLPFDPFMIKQRMPYWMYALEELRCDLTAFGEAVKLEAEGVPHARYVQHAILFDRLFRFPITGERVRNYDGLGGQLLFAYLHRNDVVRWTDNSLSIDWDRVPDAVAGLRGEVDKLYRDGIDRPKLAHWLAAHELVAAYVAPHPASTWARGAGALPAEGFPKSAVDAVLPDEFPLSMFYEALRRKLADVVESTRGVRAA